MKEVIRPFIPSGQIVAPSSKSQAHRLMILAALGQSETDLVLNAINDDIEATASCLCALGAKITRTKNALHICPIQSKPAQRCDLLCKESGSTLRFLLPVCGILGINAVFHRKGRLAQRPLSPFDRVLCEHGMRLKEDGDLLLCSGKLHGGIFELPGNISSQFLSGLLLALPLAEEESRILLTTELQSADYVRMTEQALNDANVQILNNNARVIKPRQTYSLPTLFHVEGDWSSAAFFLCAGALSEKGICVKGLDFRSAQPDRAIIPLLQQIGAKIEESENEIRISKSKLHGISADCGQFPDLVPVLCAVACLCDGKSEFTNLARLRLKESDRIHAIVTALSALGAEIEEKADFISIKGKKQLKGGLCPSFCDHRIAMACAVAAIGCQNDVIVENSECVSKSYPDFWNELKRLKGASL